MSKKEIEKRASGEIQQMAFGGTADVPSDSAPPVILIDKDRARFEVGGEPVDELVGHVLIMQRYNKFFAHKYDPTNPEPAACFSADATRPTDGSDMMPGPCGSNKHPICPHNKFSDTPEGGRRKACQNRMLLVFLADGHAVPSLIDLPPTSVNPKLKNGIMMFSSNALNFASKQGLPKYFQLVKARLSLNQAVFQAGPSSTLEVSIVGVEEDPDRQKEIEELYLMAKSQLVSEGLDKAAKNESWDDSQEEELAI